MSDEERPVLFSFGGIEGGPRVEVTVSQDSMTAWGTFYSATEPNGKMLLWNDFAETLSSSGLGSCLLEREIQDALFRFNTSHPSPERIVLAQGKLPVAERPAFLKLEPRFYSHHFQDKGGAQVDFKEFSPFVIVKKGELLARGILPRSGAPGMTIYGNEISAGKKDIKHLKPGPHTLFAHGRVFARTAGRFTLEGDVFDVSDILELDAGVGYGTGNLAFPGTVIVKGVVADGFRLAAGAGITVKGALDASEVMCHGDLFVEGGIIGKKPGLVRAGGSIKALYIEHCRVEALGSIHVTKAMLHAEIFTNADLILEETGRIVASTIWVKGNLICGQLGGENGTVRVISGTDFVIQRKMESLRLRYQHLEQEVLKQKAAGQEPSVQQLTALQALIEELNTLTPQLFANPATEIRVLSKIFEGTVIEMGYASLTLSKTLKGQVFRLSPDGKSIITAAYSKNPSPPAQQLQKQPV